jgi:hypothetical protein
VIVNPLMREHPWSLMREHPWSEVDAVCRGGMV